MSRILAYTSPARGHLYPLMPILDELRARGHDVHVRTLAAQVDLARSRGFEAEPIDPAIEAIEHLDWQARNPRAALRRAVETFAARAELDAPDLDRAVEAVSPELLVVDVNCWGALVRAEARGGHWASFAPYPLPLPSRDAPPFGPGLTPARSPLGRLRDVFARPLVYGAVRRTFLPPVNALRSRNGLEPAGDDFMTRAPLVLSLTAEPFEYPRRDWPANIQLVGPCPWDPPAEPPAWLASITRPLVLVTTSSERQEDAVLVRTAFEALATEQLAVVATLPSHDPATLTVPANARVERFLPHGPVLERAACVVTHGGMGATQKALARGVPVCAVPFGRDQFEVARRVEVAGAGTRLPAARLRPDRLRAAVLGAIACREGAERVARGFAAAGGPPRAADLLEGLLAGGDELAAGSQPGVARR